MRGIEIDAHMPATPLSSFALRTIVDDTDPKALVTTNGSNATSR